MYKMIVGIQGGRGSFNEQAFRALQERGDLDPQAKPSYLFTTQSTLQAVQDNSVDYGVFAIYNSKSKLVAESAQVIGHYYFDVVSSITIPIQHHIMIAQGADPLKIDNLMGHEEALAQCAQNLQKKFAHIPASSGENDLKDGAGVAQAIKQGTVPITTAVVSSEATATTFGMQVIASNLADDPNNATTFLLIKNYSIS